jgi:hypothetical protein
MTWLRFLNNQYQAVRDLIVGDGSPGTKSLKFDNGVISEIEIPPDAVARKWRLPASEGELALTSTSQFKAEIFNHFMGNVGLFVVSTAGSGATANFNISVGLDSGGKPGIVACNSGSTASGRVYLGTAVTGTNTLAFQLGFGVCKTETSIRLLALSDATNTYTFRFGFLNTTGVEPTNGLFARYTHSVNSGNWQFVSRINNVEQVLNTSVPVTTSWKKLFIDIAADASAGSLYIDDVLIGTLTDLSGLATVGRQVGGGMFLLKSAGTTSTNYLSDYLYVGVNV